LLLLDQSYKSRPKTEILIKENTGKTLEDLGRDKDFLNRTLIAQKIIVWIKKWDFIIFKSFCISKETMTRMKSQPVEWEKTFASYSSKD
jgi:hypothetical protein